MLCILCLALLIPAILRAQGVLPLDRRPLIEAKYGGWSGVIRLWVCEGWASGGVAGWLNRCLASFEKAHPGVYVQPEYVDAAAMSGIGGDDAIPPDLVLFPPDVLETPDALVPLAADYPLRGGLGACGQVGETAFAVPVMLGGYMWAYNAGLLPGIPNTWRGLETDPAAPPDEANRQWGAALLALCASKYAEGAPEAGQSESAGEMDLGLAIGAEPEPTATPTPQSGELDCQLPEGFAFSESAWRDFINGDAAAIPVTQREIRRLEALSDQGQSVDWRLASSGAGFTDQLLCAGVVRRETSEAQQALCLALINHLLSEACQGELRRAGAFSVTRTSSGYAAGDPLGQMEAALRGQDIAVPNCFDPAWRSAADGIVRDFIDGRGAPADLWRSLADRLGQKSEH